MSRVSATAILEYVNDPTATTRNIPQVAINMVDNLLRWVNRETFKNFGRSAMFYPTAKQPQPEKMFDIHDGFMVSVRPQWKVRMNIDMVSLNYKPKNICGYFYLGNRFNSFCIDYQITFHNHS